MNSLYVIGGQQKYLRSVREHHSKWFEYQKGVVVKADPHTGNSEMILEYVSPEDVTPEEGAILFKAASVHNGYLYLCTQTEILVFSLPTMERAAYISLPFFNDVHHVAPTPAGNLVVASSGMEMVFEITKEGDLVREWHVLGEQPWTSLAKETDYRRVNLKPHRAHPNFVFFLEEELWVTRFYQKDAISLTRPGRRIDIAVGSPHDGIVNGDFVFFTTTNGNIVIVNQRTLKVDDVVDLNAIHKHGGPLGWSRGVYVEDGKLWVGFSRIRPTKLKENVDWVKHSLKWRLRWLLPEVITHRSKWMKKGLKKELPTRLACYDLAKKECLSQMNLEPHGISAIFSIFPDSMINGSALVAPLVTGTQAMDSEAESLAV